MDAEPHCLQMYPEKVKGVTVKVENDGHRAVVTWEPGNHPTVQYKVKWWNINQHTNEVEDTILSNEYVFSQLVPGTVIGMKVAAENSGGVGEFSDETRIEAAPMAPNQLTVTNNPRFPDPTLSVNFDDPDPFPKTYILMATNTEKDDDIRKVVTKQHSANIPGLFACNVYEVTAVAVKGDLQSLPTRTPQPILTVPGKVSEVRHEKLYSRTFEIYWKKEFGVESYDMQCSKGGGDFKSKKCCINQRVLRDLEPDNQYRIRVAARNRSGYGHFSDIHKFSIDPPLALPENVRVTNNKLNPQSAIDVTVEDHSTQQTSYIVIVTLNGDVVEKKEIQGRTIMIENLDPGHEYVVFVHCGGKDTSYHDMARSRAIWTAPKSPDNLRYELISTDEIRLWCEPSDGAETYEFKIDSDDIVTLPLEATSITEPLSNSREREKLLTSDSSNCNISYPFEKINFSVTAKNKGGSSTPSILKNFRQVIRCVKQKFQKKAKDNISVDDFAHVRLKEDSSTDDVDVSQPIVKPRETAMIYGPLFSGKSALCSYLIQSQSQHEVGIILDFIDLKNNGNKMNFGGLLKTTMPDLTAEEVKILMSWMIKNQEKVLFMIENVTIEKQFKPMHDIDAHDVPKNLIYNLLKLDREILPRTRVICTTTQANLRTMIKPTKSLKLLGLSESGKTRMLKMHGKNYPTEELPHLAIFLCNPGLSKKIMNLSRKRCDILSKASVLIEAITQIFDRQNETMKNASLAVMKQEIERLQKEENASFRLRKAGRTTTKLSGSVWEDSVFSSYGTESFFEESEATGASMDCMHLQELFFRAISIALLINCADFEKVLKKKSGLKMQNAASVKIAAGLLRGETMRKAHRIISPTLKVIADSEAEKKSKALIKFIYKNCEAIKLHVYDDSNLTMDWMECCVELGDRQLWAKCSPHIKVKNSTTDKELRQLEHFLKNPLTVSSNTTVSLKYNLLVPAKVDLEMAIKQNPNGKAIIVNKYKKGTLTRKKSHRILTNESQASHRSGHEPSEPETDTDESLYDSTNKDFVEGGNETLKSHDQDCFDKGSTKTLKQNDFGEESTMQSGESQDKFKTTHAEEHRRKDQDVSSTKGK